MVSLAQTVSDIKSLKIQGATNVARAALEALSETPEEEIENSINQIIETRPTEPLLQNSLELIRLKGKSVIPLTLIRFNDIEEEIIKNGLPLIKDGMKILTHCHSSTVVKLLKTAKKNHIEFQVFLTETRPVMQGRITAKELVEAGIEATMITDSEAAFLISREDNRDIDLVFLGVDAITKDGSAYNKVGSYGIAMSAKNSKIPLYVLGTLLKFSPKPVIIEERKGAEIWQNKPEDLNIINPAFDKVPSEYITQFVTEFGLIKPEKVKTIVKKNYPWVFETRRIAEVGAENFDVPSDSLAKEGKELSNKIRGARNNEANQNFVPPRNSQENSPYKSYSALQDSRVYNEGELKQQKTPYKSYLHLNEKIDSAVHILVDFLLTVDEGTDFFETAGGIGAESSIGTWTKVTTEIGDTWERLHARILEADNKTGKLKVAYPIELFEKGNIPQLLSSVAGNIYGLKEVKNLKLLDLELPEVYVKSFPGPAFGIEGIRNISGVYNRPLAGCIIKPKLGLDYLAHSEVARAVYEGGIDFVKDDENLTSQDFNPFEKRVETIMQYLNNSGQLNKIYAFNVTGPTKIMIERANFIKDHSGNCAMIDFLTAGFSGLQELRNQNLNLIIHGHRAMHAALTRDPKEGISMLVLAKLARLCGIDSLHSGTVVGKMEGGESEVTKINEFLLSDWYGLKKVLPVASGGLYPSLISNLIKILGQDIMFNFGGGIHGHPDGSKAGAIAVKQAINAVQENISISDYAKDHVELNVALKHWNNRNL